MRSDACSKMPQEFLQILVGSEAEYYERGRCLLGLSSD